MDLDDLNWEHRRYDPLQAYSDSKLANVLFTTELQRRLTEAGNPVKAVTAHPGIARTSRPVQVGQPTPSIGTWDASSTMPRWARCPSCMRLRDQWLVAAAERLWELSEGLTGTDPMFRSANQSFERRFRELTRKP